MSFSCLENVNLWPFWGGPFWTPRKPEKCLFLWFPYGIAWKHVFWPKSPYLTAHILTNLGLAKNPNSRFQAKNSISGGVQETSKKHVFWPFPALPIRNVHFYHFTSNFYHFLQFLITELLFSLISTIELSLFINSGTWDRHFSSIFTPGIVIFINFPHKIIIFYQFSPLEL